MLNCKRRLKHARAHTHTHNKNNKNNKNKNKNNKKPYPRKSHMNGASSLRLYSGGVQQIRIYGWPDPPTGLAAHSFGRRSLSSR